MWRVCVFDWNLSNRFCLMRIQHATLVRIIILFHVCFSNRNEYANGFFFVLYIVHCKSVLISIASKALWHSAKVTTAWIQYTVSQVRPDKTELLCPIGPKISATNSVGDYYLVGPCSFRTWHGDAICGALRPKRGNTKLPLHVERTNRAKWSLLLREVGWLMPGEIKMCVWVRVHTHASIIWTWSVYKSNLIYKCIVTAARGMKQTTA